MFTFKASKQARKVGSSSKTATPLRPTIRPMLEVLEDRTMPSASPVDSQPFIITASPQAQPAAAQITSNVLAMIDQRVEQLVAFEQDLASIMNTVGQVLYQEVVSLETQVGRTFGINLNPPNPSLNTTVPQPSSDSGSGRGNASGSGSGSGATTTANNAPNQALNNSTPQSGRSSGSGSSATMTSNGTASSLGGMVAQPMTGSGSGSGGYSSGSGSATVYGTVWLDSDYDSFIDNGELPYSGATVQLDRVGYGGYLSTTTDGNGNFKFTLAAPSIPPGYTWQVQVIFPFGFFATKEGGDSQIDAEGYTVQFNLMAGDVVQKIAGIASMNVNTTQDDANNQKIQNKVTLRDAIQTGNNGPPQPAVTFYSAPNTPLSGTITLQAALDPIKTSYYIDGPGATTLTVNGNKNAGTIFTVNAGVTSTISGLTITGGSGGNGGG
jgi:hypothetical protein